MQHSTSIATLWAVTVLTSSTVCAQGTLWELQFGSAGEDHANALVRDVTGGVYVAGETWGDLAGNNAGLTDPWLARYDASGAETWSRQFGSSGFEGISFAAEDSAGGVFVGGGRCDAQCSGLDAWLARFDSSGNELWNRTAVFSAPGVSSGINAGAPDPAGGLYVGGNTEDSLGAPNAGRADAWFARYDSSGNRLWARQFGGPWIDVVQGVASNASGTLYLCGLAGWTGGPIGEAWFGRYDMGGNEQWKVEFATGAYTSATSICADGAAGAYVCGFTNTALGGMAPVGGTDAFVARYDAAGNELWTRVFGGLNGDRADAVTLSSSGGVLVAGVRTANSGGNFHDDMWLARFDEFGNSLWERTIATGFDESVGNVVADGQGGAFITGSTEGVLGSSSAGQSDPWLARFDGVESMRYCSPAVPNSTGVSSVIGAVGSNSVSAADLSLVVNSLPNGSFGYLLASESQGLSQPGNSQGDLCLSGNIGRFLGQVIQGPTATIQVDLTSIPGNPPSAVAPGDTWYFQCWFRDQNPTSTSNLTDGLCVRFR